MTQLKCNVIHCSSNKDNCCCRPDIHVGGSDAKDRCDTCCDSFTSIPEGTTNDIGYAQPNSSMPVACDATNCVYNRDHRCEATAIDIQGAGAKVVDQTKCATFRCK